jgi:NAD(P)H-nitrite reductase large subunit
VVALSSESSGIIHRLINTTLTQCGHPGTFLTSIGRFEQKSKEERTVVDFDAAGHSYRKLLLSDGKIVGAILVGYPQLTRAVSAAIKEGRDMSQLSSQRQSGMWSMLMGEDR